MTWKLRLAFGSPDLALSLLFATVNGWLLFYLVTILDVPPLLAGAVFVFGRVLDGILDPIVGARTDHRARKPVIGLALFATATVFTLVTLPVEFDASKRAMVTHLRQREPINRAPRRQRLRRDCAVPGQ